MKNKVEIVEVKSNKSLTGSFFWVYINGERVGNLGTTREQAEQLANKILEKKTYR